MVFMQADDVGVFATVLLKGLASVSGLGLCILPWHVLCLVTGSCFDCLWSHADDTGHTHDSSSLKGC